MFKEIIDFDLCLPFHHSRTHPRHYPLQQTGGSRPTQHNGEVPLVRGFVIELNLTLLVFETTSNRSRLWKDIVGRGFSRPTGWGCCVRCFVREIGSIGLIGLASRANCDSQASAGVASW